MPGTQLRPHQQQEQSRAPSAAAAAAGGPQPSTGRAFWRVSFAGHHHSACMAQPTHRFVCTNNAPSPVAASRVSADDPTSPYHHRSVSAAADTISAASSPPATRARRTLALPVSAVIHVGGGGGGGGGGGQHDVGDSGGGASSFDVVDSMPQSKLPSVRSMGSLVMVGSPESHHGNGNGHGHYAHPRPQKQLPQHQQQQPRAGGALSASACSFGSLAATPTGARSVNLADLDGCRAVPRSPGSAGTAMSFPSVSAATPPQPSPVATRIASPRRSPACTAASARHHHYFGAAAPLTPRSGGSSSDDGAATAFGSASSRAPGGGAIARPAPLSAPRSLVHFRVVDNHGSSAGVGLSHNHSRWANRGPTTISSGADHIGSAFQALLAALRTGNLSRCSQASTTSDFGSSSSPEGLPPTPPNSEVADDEYNDGDEEDDDDECHDADSESFVRPSRRFVAAAADHPGLAGNEIAVTQDFARCIAEHAAQQRALDGDDSVAAANASAIFATQAWLRRSRRFQPESSIGFHLTAGGGATSYESTAALEAIFDQIVRGHSFANAAEASRGFNNAGAAAAGSAASRTSFGPGGPDALF